MAKSLTQIVADIRGYIAKNRLKPARKTFDKALKGGTKGAALQEVAFELLLAEGGGKPAAEQLRGIAVKAEARLSAAMKHAETHLRKNKLDHAVRDVLWELALAKGDTVLALRHATALHEANGVDASRRGKELLDRKDAAGATGIFLLATLGALKTDRMKLADRLLGNQAGTTLASRLVESLYDAGYQDGPVSYILAQLAQRSGDKERFLAFAGKAFEENPDEVWTWTLDNVSAADRVEIALKNASLEHLLQAAGDTEPAELIAIAKRANADGPPGKVIRALGLLHGGKAPNACRILEGLVTESPEVAAPIADLFVGRVGSWDGSAEVFAAVVGAALRADGARVKQATDAALAIAPDKRADAWGRGGPKLLKAAPDRDDLRLAVGQWHLGQDAPDEAAALLQEPGHLDLARQWAEAGSAPAVVLRRAADLAEEGDAVADHAEWLLHAARSDSTLLAELGGRLGGAAVSPETALKGAEALLGDGQKAQAADLLSRLPLDEATGKAVDNLLQGRRLRDDRAFQTVAFRCALALGDQNRARRLFSSVEENVQVLAREAGRHAHAGRVLADVLVGQGKGEVAIELIEARRSAGDEARTLLPLADALLKGSPRLAFARLVRAKLLRSADRADDAVRDLRAIPAKAAELDEAFELLGELAEAAEGVKGGAGAIGAATLGRADIHIFKKQYRQAVKELGARPCDAGERLQRLETVCREASDLEAAHRGRALALVELDRVPEAADAHFKRFVCGDADRATVATDLEDVARSALSKNDLETAGRILEQLPDQVSDGAERSIAVIGDDKRSELLVLRSKMLLQLGRTDEAVQTLSDLVASDPKSRARAAQALEAIIDSGQARPDADFALASAFDRMERTGDALKSLTRLYDDDITSRENVAKAAEGLVVRADDPDVRLFLARVCLDMRNASAATEHAISARRLRPGARRDCVEVLRKALDLDAFAPDTHFALAQAHLAGDEADDTVRHFRAAVEVDRNRAGAAIAAMEEAAPRSQHPALLWLAVGTTYAEFQKDHDHAAAAFTKGLDASPPAALKVPLLLGRGDSHAALRHDDQAFDDFDEASKHDVLERRYYEFLRARHRKREFEKAKEDADKSATEFTAAAAAVGRFVRLGRTTEAVECAQAALAAAPDQVGPRYLVGVALHAAHSYDAAAQMLEAVRETAGADTEVGRAARMLLAESYLDNGDRTRARSCLIEIESVDANYPGLQARRGGLAPPADDPHAPPPLYVRPDFPRPTE